jgi:hypothetical protein
MTGTLGRGIAAYADPIKNAHACACEEATMSDLVPIADGMNGTPGREALGRFTPGNRAAVGRSQPFATQAAELRRAFYEAVTPADLQALARHLITQATGGNLAATKLLLLWLLGKPGEAVNPDPPLTPAIFPLTDPAPPEGSQAPWLSNLLPDDRRQRERRAVAELLRDVRTIITEDGDDLDEAPEGEEKPF